MKSIKKLFATMLVLALMLTVFQAPTDSVSATTPTVEKFSSTSDAEIAQFMMGDDLSSDKNLLYGAMPRQVYSHSSTADTKYYQEATNTGSNGTNSYTIDGTKTATMASVVALTDGSAPNADNDLNFANAIWNATEHHMTFEYDLGSACTLKDFYVCFSSRAKGNERIVAAYEIYASDSLSTLYTSPIFSISDNTDGMNKVSFPTGTTARYFAFRITEPDNGTPTASVYPRCKEIVLAGTHKSTNWASFNPLNVSYTANATSISYWMNGLAATDPSNIILNKTPSIKYYNSGSPTTVNNNNSKFSNGVFDDAYFKSPWSDSTYMLDSTYADVVWDLGTPSKFSEFWITFCATFNATWGSQFIMPKYALYCGNDKATLFNSDPIILIDCNAHNVNKIKFNARTAQYFGLRAICPNIALWAGATRLSIYEAALIGPAKRTADVTAVDSNNTELPITIGGSDDVAYEGETVKLSAPALPKVGTKTYIFESFMQKGAVVPSTKNGDTYEANVTVDSRYPVTVKYALGANIAYTESYIDNNIINDISSNEGYYKVGTNHTITTPLSYSGCDLLGWVINDVFQEATTNGTYSFEIKTDMTIRAIYANAAGGQLVFFQSKVGEQLGTFIVPTGQSISSVVTDDMIATLKMPLIFGYTQTGWSVDLDEPCNQTTTVVPTYSQNSETYNISIDGEISTTAKFDQKITLNATSEDFSAWKNGGSTISTEKNHTFYAPGTINLTTNAYGAGTQVTDNVNIVNAISWNTSTSTYNLSVMAKIDGIKEEDFIECGMLFARKVTYDSCNVMDKFNLSADVAYKSIIKFPSDGVYMITLSNITSIGQRAARAYVKYYKDGKETIAYSRTAVTANKDVASMPETKYENAITKYADHQSIKLYEDNAIPYYNATYASQKVVTDLGETDNNPTITPYLVEGAKACVVIYPGGGYYRRQDNAEGIAIAQAYNKAGYSAFVVRYRIGNTANNDFNNGYNDQAIITDGQRAVQFVRYHADEFGIDPNQVAVCGFSAGGHMSMVVSQNQMEENVVGDRAGELSNIPNATILGYAVTTLQGGTFSTMPVILGANHTAEEVTAIKEKYSGHLHASADLAPTFLFYGTADTSVRPEYNSQAYYNALIQAGATAEIHAYEGFGHGFGLGSGAAAEWHAKSVTFLKDVAGLQSAKQKT